MESSALWEERNGRHTKVLSQIKSILLWPGSCPDSVSDSEKRLILRAMSGFLLAYFLLMEAFCLLQSQLAELNTWLSPAALVLFLFSKILHTSWKKHENEIKFHINSSTKCYQLGTKDNLLKIKYCSTDHPEQLAWFLLFRITPCDSSSSKSPSSSQLPK